ncbi:MAG: LysR substrate-binding domain-containing protein [Pseudomonadota bacterium]
MSLNLPPFPALRAFHAAARHGQFREASRELGLSESAISHQVRRLEDFLHVKLFDRQGPKVRLTEAGGRYLRDIGPAIERIAAATEALAGPADRARVALTLPPSLAMLWLIPKLAELERDYPEIELQLMTTTRVVDLRREQVDLAIRHGQGHWEDVEAAFLFTETARPVCRPSYIVCAGDMAAALVGKRLLISNYFVDEWTEWARARGIEPPSTSGALRLDSQEQILAAAEEGLGVAIGRSPSVDDRLTSGRLIAPFGEAAFGDASYYLCRPFGGITSSARKIATWLARVAKN